MYASLSVISAERVFLSKINQKISLNLEIKDHIYKENMAMLYYEELRYIMMYHHIDVIY